MKKEDKNRLMAKGEDRLVKVYEEMEEAVKNREEIVKEVKINTKIGTDKYEINLGPAGYNTEIWRNGVLEQRITRLEIDVGADTDTIMRLTYIPNRRVVE